MPGNVKPHCVHPPRTNACRCQTPLCPSTQNQCLQMSNPTLSIHPEPMPADVKPHSVHPPRTNASRCQTTPCPSTQKQSLQMSNPTLSIHPEPMPADVKPHPVHPPRTNACRCQTPPCPSTQNQCLQMSNPTLSIHPEPMPADVKPHSVHPPRTDLFQLLRPLPDLTLPLLRIHGHGHSIPSRGAVLKPWRCGAGQVVIAVLLWNTSSVDQPISQSTICQSLGMEVGVGVGGGGVGRLSWLCSSETPHNQLISHRCAPNVTPHHQLIRQS